MTDIYYRYYSTYQQIAILNITKKFAFITVFSFLFLALVVTQGKLLGISSGDVEVILTGDVMLGRTVMTKSLDMNDPSYPFKKVDETLRSADLVFINLENPIITGCPRHFEGLKFCSDPKMVEGLVSAGVDVATIANNHIANYDQKGVEETKRALEEKRIGVTGLGNLVVREVGGTSFGFLGFSFVDKSPTEAELKLVADSDTKVDVLLIGVHWGEEYQEKASRVQKEIAQKLVERGADIVVGHHPHWVQNMEQINGKPVYYSLGNFIFDQMWSRKTREGLAMRLTFRDGKLVSEEKLPIYMTNWAQPEWR